MVDTIETSTSTGIPVIEDIDNTYTFVDIWDSFNTLHLKTTNLRKICNELKDEIEEKGRIKSVGGNNIMPVTTVTTKESETGNPFKKLLVACGLDPNGIKDVNIIVPDKVVEVTFTDGEKQKSVCQEPDTFSLETAISICLSKKIMGGSSAYNNAIKRGMRVYTDKLKKIEAEKAEQARIAKRKAKKDAYKARCAAKREAAEKERAIEIQKEAYIRAIQELEG